MQKGVYGSKGVMAEICLLSRNLHGSSNHIFRRLLYKLAPFGECSYEFLYPKLPEMGFHYASFPSQAATRFSTLAIWYRHSTGESLAGHPSKKRPHLCACPWAIQLQ